jgi:hypothetical protein
LAEEEDDEEEDRYGESSRYVRQNGMGNGGVYGMSNNYFSTESSTYTPHLLPMFQQQGYHNLNDPDHLEDASVLLSMAYPGGVPAGENGNNTSNNGMVVGGQTVVPDWEVGQTINMMMESAAEAEAGSKNQRVTSAAAAESAAADAAAVLPESMGNFLGTMNWLSGMAAGGGTGGKEGNTSEGPGWVRDGLADSQKWMIWRQIRAHPCCRRRPSTHPPDLSRPFRSPPSSRHRHLA